MNARMSSSSHRLHSKYLGLTICPSDSPEIAATEERMLENQIIHFTLDFTENSNSESKKKWREEVSPLACMPDCRPQRAAC